MKEDSKLQIRIYQEPSMQNYKRCSTCQMYEYTVVYRPDWGADLCSKCYKHAIEGTHNPHDLHAQAFQHFLDYSKPIQFNSDEE
jgi:hypothetical protein